MINKHLVIVRTSGNSIDLNKYNCQELGLAKEIVKKGNKVTLILAGSEYKEDRIFFDDSLYVDIIYVKCKKINQQLAYFIDIDKILHKLNPDIIQVHDLGIFMTFYVVHYAKKKNIKVVLIQGTYQETLKTGKRQLEQLFNNVFGRYILKHIDGVGCKSLRAKEYLKKYNYNSSLITPIGLDISSFSNKSDEKKLNFDHLNISDSNKVLLYIGKLEQRRNPEFMLELISSLPSEYILLMVGNGDRYEYIDSKIKQKNLRDRCYLLGQINQSEISQIYSKGDLFVLPSDYEIYGMVILESMYHGVPVISTDNAGAEMIITDNYDGNILNNLDVREWQDKIIALFDDKDILREYKSNSKDTIKTKYVWQSAVSGFTDLYDMVLS